MADQRLQQLHPAWEEGDLEAQVRLLRERMRAGELREERVRSVAILGDPLAADLLDSSSSTSFASSESAAASESAAPPADQSGVEGNDAAKPFTVVANTGDLLVLLQSRWERGGCGLTKLSPKCTPRPR